MEMPWFCSSQQLGTQLAGLERVSWGRRHSGQALGLGEMVWEVGWGGGGGGGI